MCDELCSSLLSLVSQNLVGLQTLYTTRGQSVGRGKLEFCVTTVAGGKRTEIKDVVSAPETSRSCPERSSGTAARGCQMSSDFINHFT